MKQILVFLGLKFCEIVALIGFLWQAGKFNIWVLEIREETPMDSFAFNVIGGVLIEFIFVGLVVITYYVLSELFKANWKWAKKLTGGDL